MKMLIFPLILFALGLGTWMLISCSHVPPANPDLPDNFREVEPGLFRGGQPNRQNLEFLKSLGVRTIIDLNDDEDAELDERKYSFAYNIDLIRIPLSGFMPPSESDMRRIEAILTRPEFRPIYVHCEHGQDRTGLAIGLYRVHHQGWDQKTAHEEMRRLGFHDLLLGLNEYFWSH